MREDLWVETRIAELQARLVEEEAAGPAAVPGPDRRFVIGALHQRQGRALEAARWYLAAARVAEDRGDGRGARALVRLAREVAPTLLDAVREARRLEAAPRVGMDG